MLAAIWVTAAQAQFATGGSGLYRNQIAWFSWGAADTGINQAGLTVTNSTPIGDQFLRTTCSISNISSPGQDPDLRAYGSGAYPGDGLDDLYNIGGTGTQNRLVVGVGNRVPGENVTASINCSARFGPSNSNSDPAYPLAGLVFADAEQSGSVREFVSATIAPGATVRMIDRFRTPGCTVNGTVTRSGSTVTFDGPSVACTHGPTGVAFLEGASSTNVTVQGAGRSALAIGVMVFVADSGDAPASYGSPLHLPGIKFSGGAISAGTTNYSTMTLASLTSADIKLGTTVDTETRALGNATASGDDTDGMDDEDALATPPPDVLFAAGGTYSLNNISCSGSAGIVYGYIDFNRDGDFADANERSAAAPCSGKSVNLSWTLPAEAELRGGPSYLRLRIGSIDAQVRSPTAGASDGEVEDYPITLNAAIFSSLQKTFGATGRRGANDQFVLSIAPPAPGVPTTGTTTGTAAAVTSVPVTMKVPGTSTTYTISEMAAVTTPPTDLANYSTTYVCTNTRPGGQTPSGSGTSFSVTPALGDNLSCVFTNTRNVTTDLVVGKTNASPFDIGNPNDKDDDALTPGATTTYTISVWNMGPDAATDVVVKDAPGDGLNCPSGNPVSCSAAGAASCPGGGLSVGALAGGGITIPNLGASSSSPPTNYVTLQFQCIVQ